MGEQEPHDCDCRVCEQARRDLARYRFALAAICTASHIGKAWRIADEALRRGGDLDG